MKISVRARGKLLALVDFWKGREELDFGDHRILLLTGANGSGKSVTLKSLLPSFPRLVQEHEDQLGFLSVADLRHKFGDLSLVPVPDAAVYFNGQMAAVMPSSVCGRGAFERIRRSQTSHGHGCLIALAQDVMQRIEEHRGADSSLLLLLDEPEEGLSLEARLQVALALVQRLEDDPHLYLIAATQSLEMYTILLGSELAEVVDFGGWLRGNPFDKWRLAPILQRRADLNHGLTNEVIDGNE